MCVLLHCDAALDEVHGSLQVAESFAGLVFLRGHSDTQRLDLPYCVSNLCLSCRYLCVSLVLQSFGLLDVVRHWMLPANQEATPLNSKTNRNLKHRMRDQFSLFHLTNVFKQPNCLSLCY